MENKNIETLFNAYRENRTFANRAALTDAIDLENKTAKAAFIALHPISEKPFESFLSSDRYFLGYKVKFDSKGSVEIEENARIHLSCYAYLKASIVLDKLESMEKEASDAMKKAVELVNAFIRNETESNGDTTTTVSIGQCKKAFDSVYTSLGFTGHVTSKALKSAIVHFTTTKKKTVDAKNWKYKTFIDACEKIDAYNRVEQENKRKEANEKGILEELAKLAN